ncbi:hypothetical protein HUJ05_001438 [Dendroctonus ponderosae]|nr:hypothetical protein HUJ05_001438 [Dendroctonus ponderosae]
MISPYAYGPLQRPGENDRTYTEQYALYDRYDQFECDPPQYSPPGEYSETVQEQYNQCCLLDSAPRPPDVPPRNPTMSRLNGRLASAPPQDPNQDFEPSCLVRTPSGNVYIPSGTLNHSKNSVIDYKPNSSCNSPSKDMKNSLPVAGGGVVGTNSLSYGGQMPVLPVRNNLRRPNSSHFPPAASRFHFRKGLASRCTWKCTAIALIVLCVILTAALSYISASSLLNWSYQSAKPCSVLVGDNTQIIPASKTAPSETNHSTSSRPKPPSSATSSSSGGKSIEPLYARKRRDVSSPHAVFFPNITTTSSSVSNFSSEHVGSLHVSTEGPGGSMLHEAESSTQVFVVSTNSPTVSESEDEISTVEGETTTDGVKTETLLPTTEDELHELYGELSNEESSDAALFEGEVMDAKAVDVDVAEVNETVVKSGELQHDSPILLYEKPASGEEKRKLADSSKELTGANLAEPPERDAPAPGLKNVYIQQGKSEASQTPVTEPTVKVFEIPAASSEATPSKRVQVNVTISTDPDPQNPHQTHSIYVLSVSVPTDGHEPGVELNTKEGASFSDIHEANKANPQPVESPHGGACECECPCLDGSRELLDFNSSNYDYDWLFSSKEYGFSKRKPDFTVSSTESTGTSEVWTTNCPEVTTKLPPPPTILVLEGARTFPAQSFPPDGTTFSQTSLGKRLTQEIPPYGYWNMQFYHPEAAYVKFEYTIPRGASIGVYARRNALPTHTQYDILEVLSGFKARTTRAAHSIVKKEVTHYMEQGHWFLSLYNDDGDAQEITLEAEVADDMTHNCPNGCSGKGECLMGHCQCNPGFGGDDCSEIYHSSRAAGYLSTIQLQLTPEIVPTTLKLIHLRITIEGILFEKVFEADPVIKFTYAWNRLNVYRQRVYGVTTAIVKVGYQYSNCKDVIWDVQTTKLSGHDMSISDVGGWNLDIHHRYNFHEGILQKGDGSNIYLKHKPRVILTTMGDGHQRPLDCMDCEGQATKQRLLAPVALASDRDGSIYVGDFNLIRKIQTDGTVRTLVRLNATTVSYRYHLALSSMDGNLYVSDPESHRIIKVRSTDDFSDPDHNWETVVGSGERCLPGDEAHCGDGALARDAKLAYPKGIAVSNDNVLYIADGTNIRMVDRDGIVTTVIGNHMHKSHWKPLPCEGTLNIEEVHLRWPTELAINPLDNTLHIIDDHMILQLTTDGRVKVIAGRPLHCASSLYSYDMDLATHATLVMPQSIAFSSSGDLYVAESDSQRINRVRVIGTDGKIAQYAGAESKCNCLERGCDCFEADHYLASNSKFNSISAVSVSPDGHVHIGDQSNYRIRSVMASIPDSSISREYEIYSPETQEIYIFNRFGQHIATKNILTGETSYLFTYNVNTSNGKLSTVTDAAGNKVFLLRDYSSQVNSIENTKGQKCRLKMSRMRMLHELSTPDNYNVTFDYHGPTGLLKTKIDSSGRSYVYNYDEFGRLTTAVTPTGKVISLSFDLSVIGATVKVSENDEKHLSMLIKGSSVSTKVEDLRNKIMMYPDGGVASFRAWTHSITTDTVPYNILADKEPLLAESYPIPSKQHTEIGGDLANRFEWRYYIRPNSNTKGNKNIPRAIAKVGKKLRVNGENILTMEYDRETASISVFMDDKAELLNVSYDRSSRPIRFGPKNGLFAEVELEYDRFSRLSNWKWGDLSESYGFDRAGRLSEIKYADGSSLQYAFKDMFSSLPLKVTTPRGSDYLLQYDDSGALQSLTTPRGHIHTFSLQTSLGFFKYQYFSPMNRHPYEIMYNDDGQILSKIFPHQSSRVTYIYDSSGRLETSIAGMTATHYAYNEVGLVRDVEVIEPNMELRQEFRYQSGVVKDERLKFNVKSGLDNTRYKYQYDGNNRISSIDVDINGKELPQLKVKYNQNIGVLETISDLRIYRNTFNRSVMQDTGKQFFSITDYDDHGRLKSVLINIKSFDVFRLELEYDFRNRIKLQKLLVGRTQFMDRISYNSDGHVLEVIGSSNWKYVYDENGNIQATIKEKEKTTLGYDSGDRVVQYGDVEFNSYDNSGFVVRRGEQKYRFNPKGQLIHAFEADKFQTWYYYDGQDRLIAWNDDKGNVTQYLYSNPSTPELITHLHFPKTGRTFRFLYDTRDVLITVETLEQRFYVAADQNGSPLALFDINGNLIKEIRRTPFGNIVLDTNPDFYLPVDFHGGIYDLNTKLVYINKRFYDPIVGQWVIPAWEKLASKLTTPTDIFIYRFLNNDPINAKYTTNYMTDEKSWLQLYGYDIQKMLGSEYIGKIVYNPTAIVSAPQLAPDFGIMSGLQCMVDQVNEKFADISFVPKPLLKKEPKTRNLLPRVAYRKSVFGEGVLISRVGSRALVSVVEGVNGVVQDVVTSVFNNSFFLNLQFSIHDQDFFYFVKDNVLKIRDDLEELRRLGGMFNVSTHEITEHGSATPLKELRLHNPDAVVIIKYGADPDQETRKILRHANKRAIERAWELEKQLIAAGFQGRGNWTEEEKEELVSHGDVDGYEGIDLRSIHKYPQLADDPGNVFFQRDSKRKRRKSGTRRGRIHRHDS